MRLARHRFNERTDLVVLINENMTAVRYRDRAVQSIIEPFADAIGERFVFIDDNARPHHVRIVNNRIEYHDITKMEWTVN